MKLIITGSSGFSGTNLVNYLVEFDIQRLSLRYRANQEIDFTNTDVVVHLVGKTHDLKKYPNPKIITTPTLN